MPFASNTARRTWMREWVAKRRREWFEKNGPCQDCGSSEDLRLYYPDINLKITHRIWTYSQQRRDEELSKCIALCFPCWKKKHASTAQCGSVTKYDRGCRCKACRLANAIVHRKKPVKEAIIETQ